jgi:hypothetical protein
LLVGDFVGAKDIGVAEASPFFFSPSSMLCVRLRGGFARMIQPAEGETERERGAKDRKSDWRREEFKYLCSHQIPDALWNLGQELLSHTALSHSLLFCFARSRFRGQQGGGWRFCKSKESSTPCLRSAVFKNLGSSARPLGL